MRTNKVTVINCTVDSLSMQCFPFVMLEITYFGTLIDTGKQFDRSNQSMGQIFKTNCCLFAAQKKWPLVKTSYRFISTFVITDSKILNIMKVM